MPFQLKTDDSVLTERDRDLLMVVMDAAADTASGFSQPEFFAYIEDAGRKFCRDRKIKLSGKALLSMWTKHWIAEYGTPPEKEASDGTTQGIDG